MVRHLCLLLFLGLFLKPMKGAIKTWKYTNDLLDPINWVGGAPAKDCDNGVIFPENLGSVGTLFELYIDKIILPINGEIEIQNGGYIQLTKNQICLRLKKLQFSNWLNPQNWNYGKNAAVPDAERVPCALDDVVFPPSSTVAVIYPEISSYVNSIHIKGHNVSNDEWQEFLQTEYGSEQFMYALNYQTEIGIVPRKCLSKSGCTCHYSDDVMYWICEHKVDKEMAPCLDPIRPIGHCNEICGGLIILDVKNNFILEDFQKTIPKHGEVDSYASKVIKNGKQVIQIVFKENKDYSELSPDAANDFYKKISKDLEGFAVNSLQLQISGMRISKSGHISTAFGIIFGTLIASLCIFAGVYTIYMGPLKNYHWGSRIPLREVSLRNLRPFLFAQFDNKDDGQMSMAGSVISLEKAFDNPMFGTQRPSSGSIGMEVVVLAESKPSTSSGMINENETSGDVECEKVEIEDVDDVEE